LLEQAFRFSHVRAPLQQHRSIADRKRQDVPALRQPTPAPNGGHFGAASSHTQHSGVNPSCNILGFYLLPSIVCALVGLAAALAVAKGRRWHVRKLATERLRSRELRNRIPLSASSGLFKEFIQHNHKDFVGS